MYLRHFCTPKARESKKNKHTYHATRIRNIRYIDCDRPRVVCWSFNATFCSPYSVEQKKCVAHLMHKVACGAAAAAQGTN